METVFSLKETHEVKVPDFTKLSFIAKSRRNSVPVLHPPSVQPSPSRDRDSLPFSYFAYLCSSYPWKLGVPHAKSGSLRSKRTGFETVSLPNNLIKAKSVGNRGILHYVARETFFFLLPRVLYVHGRDVHFVHQSFHSYIKQVTYLRTLSLSLSVHK